MDLLVPSSIKVLLNFLISSFVSVAYAFLYTIYFIPNVKITKLSRFTLNILLRNNIVIVPRSPFCASTSWNFSLAIFQFLSSKYLCCNVYYIPYTHRNKIKYIENCHKYINMHIHTHVYTHRCKCTCTHMHIYAYTHAHVCTCTYILTSIHTSW